MNLKVLQNDQLARHQTTTIKLYLAITAVGVLAWYGNNKPEAVFGLATGGDLSQTSIDTLLSSTNEVIAATAFGATALGADALGVVINCDGQIKNVIAARVFSNVGAGGATVSASGAGQTSALPNTLAALVRAQKTAGGNIALQTVLAGLDAAASGLIQIELDVELT